MNKKLSSASKIRNKNTTTLQRVVNIFDIQLRLYETLCFPLSIKSNNSEEPYSDNEQLVRDTKQLYNTLNLLNAKLDIPSDFLNYVQLNKREKQLLVSLKEHMNLRNNKIQNNELIESFRTRMFGYASEVSENDFFIPPLPFDGYVRTKKVKNQKNTSIDYDLDVNQKFVVNLPTVFPVTHCTRHLIDIEEEIQFSKFGQFLTSDYHNCDQQNVDLYKSLKCRLSFNRESTSNEKQSVLQEPSEYDELNTNSEKLNKLKETDDINEDDEEMNTDNVILPNQATLLGFKNLLLWKLLYDYQDESRQQCESMASLGNEQNSEQTTTNSQPVQTESAEYQLLRTRLLQLFKFPISLSNTILQMHGPEKIFLTKEKPIDDSSLSVSKKRKFEDTKCVKLNKKKKNVPTNSDLQLDLDIKTQELPVRSKMIKSRKNYKVMSK